MTLPDPPQPHEDRGGATFPEGPVDSRLLGSPAGRELAAAFLGREMRLHYQPKFELTTGAMVGVEALIRWEHPARGRLPPSTFISLAEQTGLIVPIGAWVIQEACRQARRWQQAFPDRPSLEVSVNVSARQFDAHLLATVADALADSGTPPSSLCVEITESLLMNSPERADGILGELSALGVALSIDDFGTGYSSLARLKSFPLDELKVDKSFVDGLGGHADHTAIVASIVAMAHAMDLRVVAEGVETSEQADRLETLGCDRVQGFLFGHPGPAADIDALLAGEGVPSDLAWGTARGGRPTSSGGYRPLRVLVVDDSTDVCQLATVTLTAAGFAVTAVGGGAAALAAAAAEPPDCVLLDLIMPDMNGIDVCRTLRSRPSTSGCTILILTSVSDARGKIDAFIAGADDYIVKPFSPRHLLDRVNAEMRRSREDAAATGAPAGGWHPDAEPRRSVSRRSRNRYVPARELGDGRPGGRHG